jgi:hypothetical protein
MPELRELTSGLSMARCEWNVNQNECVVLHIGMAIQNPMTSREITGKTTTNSRVQKTVVSWTRKSGHLEFTFCLREAVQ